MKDQLLQKIKYTLWMVFTLLTFNSIAQPIVVQVGTGTSTNGNSGGTPYGTQYEDGKVTYLITKSELNALNIKAGDITALAFNVQSPSYPECNGFTIKLGHTTATTLTGYVATTFTTCYTTGTSVSALYGWNTYTFTNSFSYNNIDNIVVEVCFDNDLGNNFSSYQLTSSIVQSTSTSFNSVFGRYGDVSSGCANESLPNISAPNTNRPNMRLSIIYPPKSENNIGVVSIDSPTIFHNNVQDVYATVKNFGTNKVNSFIINWSVNGVIQTPISSFASLDTSGTANNTMQLLLGAYSFPNGVISTIKAWTSFPNFFLDTIYDNDTSTVERMPALNGTFTIGGTVGQNNFATFDAAIKAMDIGGVSGPVVFNVKTGTYNESITLNQVIGASAAATITFTSQANHVDSVILGWNSDIGNDYVIKFGNNANYYVFDKLTINQNATSTISYGIRLRSTSSFDTIRNCKINMPLIYNSYSVLALAYRGNGICFDNNIIVGSDLGIKLYGISRSTPMKNLIISNNMFNNYRTSAIYLIMYSTHTKITNNTFNPNIANNIIGQMYFLEYNDSGFIFMNNNYNGMSGTSSDFFLNKSINAPTNKSLIANNKIQGGNIHIMLGSWSNNQEVVHNSINFGNGLFEINDPPLANYRVLNNIFTGTYNYVYFVDQSLLNSIYIKSDYNLVNVSGLTPYYIYSNISLPTLRNTYPSFERNSISYPPAFISPTKLMPNAADSGVWAINGRGTHLGYALNDANNVPRPQTPAEGVPDLGAYEVTPTSIPPMAIAVPATPVAGGTQAFLFGTDTVAKFNYDAFAPVPTNLTVRQYTGVRNPNAGPTKNYTNVYIDAVASGSGGYLFDMNLHYKDPQIGTNPTESALRVARYDLGFWSIYNNNGDSANTASNTIKASYVSEFGSFLGTDAVNPVPVKLITFIAKANYKNAALMWQTATEKNASLFEIFSSIDGTNFTVVGKIDASGNSSLTTTYNFTDVDALVNNNKVYYKLKIIDVDGTYTFSDAVIITTNDTKIATIEVYPNPFNNNVTVSLVDNSPAKIEVINILGLSVYHANTSSANGFINIDLSQLINGAYYIKVKQNDNTTVQKLVKK